MSIQLHIGTLVIDGLDIQPHQAAALKEAVEAVLTHQLSQLNQADSLQASLTTAFTSTSAAESQPVNAGSISISRHHSVANVGEQIGNAIYWGIRK